MAATVAEVMIRTTNVSRIFDTCLTCFALPRSQAESTRLPIMVA